LFFNENYFTLLIQMEHNKLPYINQRLDQWVERFPRFIDPSILKDKDRLFAYFDNDYIQKRSTIYLLRILLAQHLQRKKMLSSYSHSNHRSLEFRIISGQVKYPFGSKKVLGILVQFSLSDRYELFDEEIFQRAVHKLLPNLHLVKGTLYKFHGSTDNIQTWYAEFEKAENQSFTLSELSLLKKSLGEALIERTERLVPSVFKIRNQEEVLRNILTLSQEVDRHSDLPQVMISFETQTSEEVTFTVIAVRAEDNLSPSLEHLIQHDSSSCRWILERKQLVRYLENHHPIVAYLFQVLLIPDHTILRSDGSLNFFAARQKIAALLTANIGEYRDFNGGILIKQEEALMGLRSAFPQLSSEQIENVFYSITPIELQTILPSSALQAIIDLTTQTSLLALTDAYDYHLVSSSKPPYMMILLSVPNGSLYEKAKEHLQVVEFPEDIKASFSLATKKAHLFGYLISLEHKKFGDRFLDSLSNLLFYWANEVKQLKILRLTLNIPIVSLDPRIGGDAISAIFLKMLFEGLMRIGPDGKLQNAIAEKIEILEDRQTYLFHLKHTQWSNGDPVTSHDFEYAWKKVLSPEFKSPFNYFLFNIKNAEKAKQGLVSMQEVGIQSLNDHLLKVELSTVAPHFLEMLALPIFSPVHRSHDMNLPNWPIEEGRRYICNGAFKIEKNYRDSGLVLIRNPLYWEKEAIHLDRIVVASSHLSQSQEMFSQNQIHWLGPPFGYSLVSHLKPGPQDTLVSYDYNALYWAVCQTEHPFLKNKKIRKALSTAIDRKALLEALHYQNCPAFSPLPPLHSQVKEDPYPFSPEVAEQLWKEGLEELGLSQNDIPVLEIQFVILTHFGKQTAEFLSHSWRKILGMVCRIQGCDHKTLLSRMAAKDFHISLTGWQAWVNDPFYTLNAFIKHDSPSNFSRSLDPGLIELIQSAQLEKDDLKRNASIKQIELQLIDEQPIIPLFNIYCQSLKKKCLQMTPNHPLMDFKWARLETE
jgi:oligopeptide transport system substrate-binding protein